MTPDPRDFGIIRWRLAIDHNGVIRWRTLASGFRGDVGSFGGALPA